MRERLWRRGEGGMKDMVEGMEERGYGDEREGRGQEMRMMEMDERFTVQCFESSDWLH